MDVSEDKIKKEWDSVDSENLEQALRHLKKCEIAVREYLADVVASLCGVSTKEMMSNSNAAHISQPRWLYWYAYRYMTGESYTKMSNVLNFDTKGFTTNGIRVGVEKMSTMIDTELIWNKRWTIVKKIIKLRGQDKENVDNTIVVQVPKSLKGKVNITIKEK